jgi:hypothetical protein
MHRRALARAALHPDAAAVFFNYLFCYRKTESVARLAARSGRVGAVEALKDAARFLASARIFALRSCLASSALTRSARLEIAATRSACT